jgi:hypothetical protein
MRLFFVERGVSQQSARKFIIDEPKKELVRKILLTLYTGDTDHKLRECKTFTDRLELWTDMEMLDFWAKLICLAAIGLTLRNRSKCTLRKPIAAEVTDAVVGAYRFVTRLPVTRVSKVVEGKRGLQEVGQFAQLLEAVFRALDVHASPAGQVKLLKRRAIKK